MRQLTKTMTTTAAGLALAGGALLAGPAAGAAPTAPADTGTAARPAVHDAGPSAPMKEPTRVSTQDGHLSVEVPRLWTVERHENTLYLTAPSGNSLTVSTHQPLVQEGGHRPVAWDETGFRTAELPKSAVPGTRMAFGWETLRSGESAITAFATDGSGDGQTFTTADGTRAMATFTRAADGLQGKTPAEKRQMLDAWKNSEEGIPLTDTLESIR